MLLSIKQNIDIIEFIRKLYKKSNYIKNQDQATAEIFPQRQLKLLFM